MAKKRTGLSKKLRFEVFKRDGFACQYCGAHPPGVLLHVDHITAVSAGGTNEIDNLITACEPCNLGKGARDLSAVPQSLASRAEDIREREDQIAGYQQVMESRRERLENEKWEVAEVLEPGSSDKGMHKSKLLSIRQFIERLGFHSVLDAAEIAAARFPYGGQSEFRYFCGICWKRVREAQG